MNRKFYQKWNAFYSKVSLRYVIWGAFTLTALLGAVLMGTSFYNRFSLQLQGIVEKQNRALIEQVNNTLTSELRNIMRISDSLYFSVLKSEENVPVEEGFALLYDTNKSSIQNIALFSKEGDLLVSAPAAKLKPGVDVTKEAWFQNAVTQTENQHFSRPHVQNLFVNSKGNYAHVLTLSRMVQVPDAYEVQDGVLLIDLKYEQLESIFKNVSLGEEGYIYLVDGAGNLIYHPQQQLIYGGLKEERIEDILASKGDFLETEEGEDSKLYTMSKSEKTGWTVVGASYVTELMKNNRQAQMLYLLAAAGILIGVILISSFISSEITKPLRRLRDSMSLVEKGDFEQASVEITAENEIGSLSKSFNAMTQKIHALMEQNIYEQKQKRKSEMKALQAQINPHFLYNTLDSIIWMSEAGENDQVVLMTSALAKLLRQSISNDREQITVAEEIDYVRSYLTIQKMRYKDKLEYTIDVEERILDVRIIKFVLQPLVENAIYHGLKYKETKGNLDIRGYRRGNRVCLVVADDGAGMEESELEHILEKKEKKTKSNGVGVYNVQKRLQLYYGPEYGISYISRKGEGTVATVTIPLDGGKSNEETGR